MLKVCFLILVNLTRMKGKKIKIKTGKRNIWSFFPIQFYSIRLFLCLKETALYQIPFVILGSYRHHFKAFDTIHINSSQSVLFLFCFILLRSFAAHDGTFPDLLWKIVTKLCKTNHHKTNQNFAKQIITKQIKTRK